MIYTRNKIWWQDHEYFVWSWPLQGEKKLTLGFPTLDTPVFNGEKVSVGKTFIRIGGKPVFKFRDLYLEKKFGWPTADKPKFLTVYQDYILFIQGHKSRVLEPSMGLIYSLDYAIVNTPKGFYKLGPKNKLQKYDFKPISNYFNLKKIGEVHE